MNFNEEQLYIGTFRASVNDRWLSLGQADRRRHMYVIGQTGSGKSTLLNSCILQDILTNRGFAFIDPHGDSAELIIDSIPKHRIRDVAYFNPADTDFPLGFNPLRGVPKHLHATATANLIAAFRSIWREFWGAAYGACFVQYHCGVDGVPRQSWHFPFGYPQNTD